MAPGTSRPLAVETATAEERGATQVMLAKMMVVGQTRKEWYFVT